MSGSYTIPINGLKEGRHTIDFEIGKEFFEQFEESEVKEGSLIANIEMDKRSAHSDLVIRISGSVRICRLKEYTPMIIMGIAPAMLLC